MKKLAVSDNCIACGLCFSDYLVEKKDGKAAACDLGFITDAEAEEVKSFVENCPVQAITLTTWTEGNEKERLTAVKRQLEEFKNYQVYRPTEEEMICDKNLLRFEMPSEGLRSRFSYRSDSQAEREGLRAFDRIAHSQRRQLAQSILVQYKKIFLDQYSHYERNDSCYFFRENKKIEQHLQGFARAISEATDGKLAIPDALTQFQSEPENLKLYATPAYDFEETYAVGRALENVESVSWYDSWVDSDEKELASRSLYAYDISKTVAKLGEHIKDGCIKAIREVGVKVTNDIIKQYQKTVTKNLQSKIQEFETLISNYSRGEV